MKILTLVASLLVGITAMQAQTAYISAIIGNGNDWKIVKSIEVNGNQVVYTLSDDSQVRADAVHGQPSTLPVIHDALYCVPGTVTDILLQEVNKTTALVLCGAVNRDDIRNFNQYYLPQIKSADFSRLDMSAVTSVHSLFFRCAALERVDFGGKIGSQVTILFQLFCNCTSLEEVDFSGCDLSGVTEYTNCFLNCSNLRTIKAVGCNDKTVEVLRNALSKVNLNGVVIVTSEPTPTTAR